MWAEPRIGQFMSGTPLAVEDDAQLMEARRLMLEQRVRHLPVVRGTTLVGLLSDRDLKLILGPELDYPEPSELSVADAMVDDPYVVDVATPLRDVLMHMAGKHIGAALITDEGVLAGIFTATDACRHFADRLAADASAGSGDWD